MKSIRNYSKQIERLKAKNETDDGVLIGVGKPYELVKNKDYFVLTTNVDHQFQLSEYFHILGYLFSTTSNMLPLSEE